MRKGEIVLQPIIRRQNLDWSKLKQIADDISKCIKNEKYVPYMVENIVRKGEIVLKPIIRRQNFRLVQTETNCRRYFKEH